MVGRGIAPILEDPEDHWVNQRSDSQWNFSWKIAILVIGFVYMTALLNGMLVGYFLFERNSAQPLAEKRAFFQWPNRPSAKNVPIVRQNISPVQVIGPPSIPYPGMNEPPVQPDLPLSQSSAQDLSKHHSTLSGRSFDASSVGGANFSMTPQVKGPSLQNGKVLPRETLDKPVASSEPSAKVLKDPNVSVFDWQEKSLGK